MAEKLSSQLGVKSPLESNPKVPTEELKVTVEELISKTGELNLGETKNIHGIGEVPSQCKDSIWVWAKTSDEVYSRLDDEMGGKWLVFLDEYKKDANGLTALDKAWALIEKATMKKAFYQAKVSTTVKEPHSVQSVNDRSGVIVVYTKDFGDTPDVLKVAENISLILKNLLPPKYTLRYKTNAATDARLYPSQNCKNVTLYRYSARFGLQERDGIKWGTPKALNI